MNQELKDKTGFKHRAAGWPMSDWGVFVKSDSVRMICQQRPLNTVMPSQITFSPGDQLISGILYGLVPQPYLPPDLTRDLGAFHTAIGSIVEAVDSGTLTQEEGRELVHFVSSRFAVRRVEESLAQVVKNLGSRAVSEVS